MCVTGDAYRWGMSETTPATKPPVAEAARIARLLLAELPPVTIRDRVAVRRIEGAIVVLDVVAART